MLDQDTLLQIIAKKERQLLQLKRLISTIYASRGWKFILFVRKIKHPRLSNNVIQDPLSDQDLKIQKFIKNLEAKKPNLILINHETTLTGAPLVLLDLANAIKRDSFFNVSIINIMYRGPDLDDKLIDHNSITLYEEDFVEIIDVKKFVMLIKQTDPKSEFIINTLILNRFATILREYDFTYSTWAHELELSWEMSGLRNVKQQLYHSKIIFVDSKRLQNEITKFEDPTKVKFIENGISFKLSKDKRSVRISNKFLENDILITIAGIRSVRKGFDLFPYFIYRLKKHLCTNQLGVKVKVVWIGDFYDTELNYFVSKQLNNLVEDPFEIILLNNVDNFVDYINASDHFVSLSREDSAPQTLAVANYLGVPNSTLTEPDLPLVDVYDKIQVMVDKIVFDSDKKITQGLPVGYYDTWDAYWKVLKKIIVP